MPEGDTIFRTARTLHAALSGRRVDRVHSVYAEIPPRAIEGRTVERAESRGKHLLLLFSGGLALRTHQRMHGSWHVYKPGERWWRPRDEARLVLETDAYVAVGFLIPDAELIKTRDLARSAVARLGPDPLRDGDAFDRAEAVRRLRAVGGAIADALLRQDALAGVGNVFKCELLFRARIDPWRDVADLSDEQLFALVDDAAGLLRLNVSQRVKRRRTRSSLDPEARVWVYDRAGLPCRDCGNPIERERQGVNARSTWFCRVCQGVAD